MVNASFLPRPPSLLDPFGQPDQMNRASLLEPQRQRMLAKTRTQRWINSLSPSEKYAMGPAVFDMPQRPPSMPDPRFDPADPNIASRGTILPIGRTKSGEEVWTVPQIALDMFSSAQLPGAVARGYNPTFEDVAQMTLDTTVGGGLLSRAPAGALGANVWHGSPHKWMPEPGFPKGRPDLTKIGTGEGVQAYGHGFYSADAPGVAKSYKENLAFKYGDRDIAEMLYSQKNGNVDEAIKSLKTEITQYENKGWPTPEYRNQYDEALEKLEGFKTNPPDKGQLYKLDLPDEDIAKMLDWDAPLSEQPESVRDFAAHAFARETGIAPSHQNYDGMVATIRSQMDDTRKTGEDLYRAVSKAHGGDQAASEALRKAGIPGLKYYDQMSRKRPIELLNETKAELIVLRKQFESLPDGPNKTTQLAATDAQIKQVDGDIAITKSDKPQTRNYVTWDQDVLDRAAILDNNMDLLGNKADWLGY